MEAHRDISDAEFEEQFKTCVLNPTWFTHEGHLRLAWIHVTQYGVKQACVNVCEQILKFDIVHGKGEKFYQELTIGSVEAIAYLIGNGDSDNFQDFLHEFPEVLSDFKSVIETSKRNKI